MNKNLERHLNWISNNLEYVEIVKTEYLLGSSIADIVFHHPEDLNRHKVYALLDYANVPRRNNPNDYTVKFNRMVDTIKSTRRD